tara:strand:+ start:338 stop:697 length:360 start_codon:yes stop_codon:yes gene_type:complete
MEYIAQLEAENAKLAEIYDTQAGRIKELEAQVDIAVEREEASQQACGLPDAKLMACDEIAQSLVSRIAQLEAENAKLRELAKGAIVGLYTSDWPCIGPDNVTRISKILQQIAYEKGADQ